MSFFDRIGRVEDRRRGAMLIIALGVLALMVILGTAFASIMRLEKRATANYIEATRMKMLLDSALDRVVAGLQGAKNSKSFTYYKDAPWLYIIKGEDDLGHGRVPIEDPRVGKWEIFAEQAGNRYSYKTKIIDCSSQINLNGRQDTLARMLDYLGEAIEQSIRLKMGGRHVTNPFYTKPNRGGDRIRGTHILQLRKRLPGAQFSAKTQLLQLIGPENYDILKDFVTVHSWEDPDTYKPTDGMDEVVDPFGVGGTSVGGGRSLGGGGGNQKHPTAYMGASRVDSEPRHPININTAPSEVLIAVLRGLAGRRVFPFSRLGSGGGGMVQADQNATILGDRIIAKEEYRDVTPRAVFVYAPPLEYQHAQRIAERIVAQRKMRPFMTWRTNNDGGSKGFEDFIDDLDQSFFPSPGRAEVVDTDQPMNATFNGLVMSGNATSPLGRLWVKGHAIGATRQLRRELSLTMHDQYAWFYDLAKGIIKANFNPNTRLNRCNPNVPAFCPVDKSDLVWLKSRTELLKGHTTEFCFDTMGVYEVTTLGRINRTALGAQSKTRSRTAVSRQPGAEAFERPDYEKRYRSIVKIFDVLRHTNQFQFERSFLSQGRSSKKDRKYVLTWPEPMDALTELGTAGSPRDGRVELAGMNDGQRLLMPPNMRFQAYMSYPSIRMALGFMDRSSESITRLKRVRLQGTQSLLKDEYTDALRDVFDANYSRIRSTDGKYYRRTYMQTIGGQLSQEATWYDPQVAKEVLGTDLFPDGLSTSIKRMNHLGSRHLVLPARSRIGDPGQSGGNTQIGESRNSQGQDNLGNVPYYRGGLAFWVKFEFDGDDPVFSGLIGCSQVINMVSPNKADYNGSEGTQFYLFKNSEGYLRVVRMYYHQAFLSGGGGGEGGDAGSSISLYPDPGMVDANAGGADLHNPILDELDPWKVISRSDLVVDVRHFAAHEWHHIAMDWDDQNPVWPIRVYVDFQEAKEAGSPRMAQANVDGVANSWVRLNERQPRDGLQVGGIVRLQGVSDAGVFKWYTNSISAETGSGVRTIAPSVKRILANATIDELVTYEGSWGGAKRFYTTGGSPGYFTNQSGEYANVMEIPLPPDVTSVVLRSFDWTSYYPTTYTDSRFNSVPQKLQKSPMSCRLLFRSDTTPPAEFQEPWRNPSIPNLVSGRRAYAGTGAIEKRQKAELVYMFKMTGASSPTGNTAGGVVQTPVLEDVTLTYFLPSPKILAQEEDT